MNIYFRWMKIVLIVATSFYILGCSDKNQINSSVAYYAEWKREYIQNASPMTLRVVNPQENDITVSEGMAYGMLFSAANGDKAVFDGLNRYVIKYRDDNGLMNWRIDKQGVVTGEGSATDADQDIAYALIQAYELWGDEAYRFQALDFLRAIINHEVGQDYLLLPGDRWGSLPPFNPSYVCLGYYGKFYEFTEDEKWRLIHEKNRAMLIETADDTTGLSPDWVSHDGGFIDGKDAFGYEAVRVPIRLLHAYNNSSLDGDKNALGLLYAQHKTISKLGYDSLKAELTLAGAPVHDYLDTTFSAAYTAISAIYPKDLLHQQLRKDLIQRQSKDYYGDSLKLWTLLMLNE